MVLGDPESWKIRFTTIDERILQRISAVWAKCLGLLSKQTELPDEDTITINLVSVLCKDQVVRRICNWIEFQFEPFGVGPDGVLYSKGKIDLAVLLDWERERYLAYECKRLNVINSGTRSSLGTRYVEQGMMRFVTEQYAEGLPIGCMLGYVMDGDIAFAVEHVRKAISANQSTLALIGEPVPAPQIDEIQRFLTTHTRPPANTTIEVRHALLPFVIKASETQ